MTVSKSRRKAIPYDTDYGTVRPGDNVYVVTKCTGTVNVQKGVYLGVAPAGGVQVRVDIFRTVVYYAGTDNHVDWEKYCNMTIKPELVRRRELQGQRITTLIKNEILPV
jgi:hypothetical protein